MCGDKTTEAYSRVGRTKVLQAILFAIYSGAIMHNNR